MFFLSDGVVHATCLAEWPHREVFEALLTEHDDIRERALRMAATSERHALHRDEILAFHRRALQQDPHVAPPVPPAAAKDGGFGA